MREAVAWMALVVCSVVFVLTLSHAIGRIGDRVSSIEQRVSGIEEMGARIESEIRGVEAINRNHGDVIDRLSRDIAYLKPRVKRALGGSF